MFRWGFKITDQVAKILSTRPPNLDFFDCELWVGRLTWIRHFCEGSLSIWCQIWYFLYTYSCTDTPTATHTRLTLASYWNQIIINSLLLFLSAITLKDIWKPKTDKLQRLKFIIPKSNYNKQQHWKVTILEIFKIWKLAIYVAYIWLMNRFSH